MNTLKLPPAVFTLLFAILVFTSGAYSNPSDVIFEYPAVYGPLEGDSAITFDSVRNELSADGEWIKVNENEIDSASVTDGSAEFDDDINKEYVWRPNNVDENWSPYTNGYWTYTNCGWMWVSYYRWGWRPYHYGRWWWSPRWGWVWSPGYIWAPAWVVWMFNGDYCGWYPLSPRVRWWGHHRHHHHHHHHHGYYCGHLRYRVRHWVFTHYNNFSGTPITPTVIIDPNQYTEMLKYSKFASDIEYANGIVKNTGPELKEIEKSAGKKLVAEDVTKYNTSKKVNEYVKKVNEEKKKYEEKTALEKGTRSPNYEKQTTKEERYNKREDSWEEHPYTETPKENKENKSGEKKNEGVNEKKENNNRNENYYKQETPEYEAPRKEQPKQEQPKYESPKQEKKNDAPKQEEPKKNESPPKNQDNNSKQNNENKSDNGNNQKGNKR